MSSAKHRVRIGTSGYHYAHWRGDFYPEKTPSKRMLSLYVDWFDTVEMNNTFYQLPAKKDIAAWREAVPAGFIFSLKASRYMTHMKKLKNVEEPLRVFMERAAEFGDTCGPILFQLPPHWSANPERLAALLTMLPRQFRYAFEFRDPSWFCTEVYRLLDDRGVGLCVYSMGEFTSPLETTGGLVYVRFHGPGDAYAGSYTDTQLSEWAGRVKTWRKAGNEVFCYFNNDIGGHAPRNAHTLKSMLS